MFSVKTSFRRTNFRFDLMLVISRWADEYLILLDYMDIGYTSVMGLKELSDLDTIFEQVLEKPKSTYMESQTNDLYHDGLVVRIWVRYSFGGDVI